MFVDVLYEGTPVRFRLEIEAGETYLSLAQEGEVELISGKTKFPLRFGSRMKVIVRRPVTWGWGGTARDLGSFEVDFTAGEQSTIFPINLGEILKVIREKEKT